MLGECKFEKGVRVQVMGLQTYRTLTWDEPRELPATIGLSAGVPGGQPAVLRCALSLYRRLLTVRNTAKCHRTLFANPKSHTLSVIVGR